MKAFLGAVIVALSGLLLFQWSDWPAPTTWRLTMPPIQSDKDTEQIQWAEDAAALTETRSRENYLEVIERPLFVPDRKPIQPEAGGEQEPADEAITAVDSLDLLAIIITPSLARAWVRESPDKDHVELQLGEAISGWTVREIGRNSLVLERQGEKKRLQLRQYSTMPQPLRAPEAGPPIMPPNNPTAIPPAIPSAASMPAQPESNTPQQGGTSDEAR